MAKKATPAAKTSGGTATQSTPAAELAAAPPVQREIPAKPSVGADKAKKSPPEVTHQMIADRAYFLYKDGAPGTPDDHWRQAEHEMRGT